MKYTCYKCSKNVDYPEHIEYSILYMSGYKRVCKECHSEYLKYSKELEKKTEINMNHYRYLMGWTKHKQTILDDYDKVYS